ncbi:MAG: hypothetical protein K9G70_04305 [Prolixibacteraceae bacterium]|nr:hypothetical protein [Prolixibacteraceae bacterium]
MNMLLKHLYKSKLALVFILFILKGYSGLAVEEHPRGLFGYEKLNDIRERVHREPYRSMFKVLIDREEELSSAEGNVYKQASLIKTRAFIFALTGDDNWGDKTFEAFQLLASDPLFVNNDYSFGLTRAAILMAFSLSYDLCYNTWSNKQRNFAHNITSRLMQSVSASMGPSGNYVIESNWMGVRYGSAMFAAVVLNDTLAAQKGEDVLLSSHIWDLKERLRDHVDASHTPRGWFVESMGYHDYDASFVWPALIAFQNATGTDILAFDEYVPKILNALDQHISGTVSIPAKSRLGIKPDLADDNVGAGFLKWPLALRIMPQEQLPFIRWMHDYFLDFKKPGLLPDDVFYSIVFYDDKQEKRSPTEGDYLNYVDTIQGVALFRNTFEDSTDIVAAFNASSYRKRGHAGPDNLTFRIAGLGNIWVVGGGRTQDPRGQTNLFPGPEKNAYPRPWPEGEWIDHEFFGDGSGYAIAAGSCLGVENHKRFFAANYSVNSGAKAFFVVSDVSENGKLWRLHTPGFNTVEVLDDGVLIHAPNQSSMKIALPKLEKADIRINNVKYGGSTVRHNTGVMFHQNAYYDNHLIDIKCDRNLLVVITLADAGKPHPLVKFDDETSRVMVGSSNIDIPFY